MTKESRGPGMLWAKFRQNIHEHVMCPRPSPRHAPPRLAQLGERASVHMCFFLFLLHTLTNA
jgi:hypothetical protein